mgnify:CR=1 FL=1
MLDEADRNLNAIIEVSTHTGRERVICQRYLPSARKGDKRVIMLNGEPLGGILRVPREDDNRGNIHVGGTVVKADYSFKAIFCFCFRRNYKKFTRINWWICRFKWLKQYQNKTLGNN